MVLTETGQVSTSGDQAAGELIAPITLIELSKLDAPPSRAHFPKRPAFERVAVTAPVVTLLQPLVGPPTETPQSLVAQIAASLDSAPRDSLHYAELLNPGELASACEALRPVSLFTGDETSAVGLLVFVTPERRVFDVRIEVSSGSKAVDAAAAKCVVAAGLFQPEQFEGQPVGAWQRFEQR